MKKNYSVAVKSILCLILTVSLFAGTYNAVLISLDGAQRAHLQELLDAGKLPNLQELKKNGAIVEIKITGHETETGPGHAEMLTGLPKELNNVSSNKKYKAIPEGVTVGERLEKALGENNIVTVMVMGKEKYMGAKAEQPYVNAKKSIDVWDGDAVRLCDAVGIKALGYIEQYKDKRFFAFLHFKDTDTEGHAYGENSKEYEAAMMKEDTWVGKVISKLKELKLYDKTLVYVTADHGFDEGARSHKNAPDIFLITNDKEVKKNGTQADIVPTILTQFDVNILTLNPALPGKPLNR